jgi:hypothetical protein
MKKLFTIVCTLALGGALAFAQTGGDKKPAGKTDNPQESAKTADSGKKGKAEKKGHKGGKKSKKGSSSTTSSTTPK